MPVSFSAGGYTKATTGDCTLIMNGGNVKGLMAQPEIDGGLIGGASLDAAKFAQVVNY